jgi:hypothetical protein
VGLVAFAALARSQNPYEPGGWDKLVGHLGLERYAGGLIDLLYAALFGVMNAGYLNSIRGTRSYRLVESQAAQVAAIEARPITGWARARIRLAADTTCYVSQVRRTPLAIGLAALLWLVTAGYVWRGSHVWWLALAIVVAGAVHVWMLTQRAVVVSSSHGSEDRFHGDAAQVDGLHQQLAALVGTTAVAFERKTLFVIESTFLNRTQLTAVERVQEVPWMLYVAAAAAVFMAVAGKAPALALVGVVLAIVAYLLSKPKAVARFEGGAEMPIPTGTFGELDESVPA